jgi:hypothetical protein
MRANACVALLAAGLLGCQQSSGGDPAGQRHPASSPAGRKAGTSGSGADSGGLLGLLRPDPIVIPEGTTLPLDLETSLSSESSRSGELVVARLASDVRVGERVVLAAGTEVRGRVTAAVPAGKVKTRARLAWDFDHVVVKGREHPIETRALDVTAGDTRKRDGAIVAGGAAAGAVVGAIADGKKGAGIGALLGAGAGTGVVLTNKGKPVEVPAGSRLSVRLSRELRLG